MKKQLKREQHDPPPLKDRLRERRRSLKQKRIDQENCNKAILPKTKTTTSEQKKEDSMKELSSEVNVLKDRTKEQNNKDKEFSFGKINEEKGRE